jgi:hypothetical protein
MGKPSAPAPVDPTTVANAQTASNEQTAQFNSQLNNYNASGPYGSVDWTQNPSTSQWTQTTQLSPAEQAIFDRSTEAQQGALGIADQAIPRIATALGAGDPYAELPSLTYGVQAGPIQTRAGSQDLGPSVQNAADAAYAAETRYLDPQWVQAGEQAQSTLANQGLNPNSAAYQNAMQQFGAQENQAYQGARNAAVAAGDAEQNTLFGQQLQSGEFANAAQAQAFGQALDNAQLGDATQQTAGQEAAYAQQLPINAFDALMSSGQVGLPQAGHYTPSQAGMANVLGAYELAGRQAQQAYQADMANYGASLGGLFNLGAAALAASDRRLKRDVRRIGRHALGVAIYAYRYLWDGPDAPLRIGVMAQELAPIRPDLVVDLGGGVLAVNYGGL